MPLTLTASPHAAIGGEVKDASTLWTGAWVTLPAVIPTYKMTRLVNANEISPSLSNVQVGLADVVLPKREFLILQNITN